jgi:hypothetical protein
VNMPGPAMVNVYDPHFDEPREHEGFRARRARLGHQLATERLGLRLCYHQGVTPPEVGDVDPA